MPEEASYKKKRKNKKLLHKRLLRVKTKPTKSSGKIVGKCIAAEDKKI